VPPLEPQSTAQSCQNVGCQFLHENGEEVEAFGKEDNIHTNRAIKSTVFPRNAEQEYGLPQTATWLLQLIPGQRASITGNRRIHRTDPVTMKQR
jgi:hypothetical protein